MDWDALRENLTEAQVVDVLGQLGVGVEASTLRKWRQRDEGPPWWRAVGSVYYPREKLRAWIEQQQEQPTARPRRRFDEQP